MLKFSLAQAVLLLSGIFLTAHGQKGCSVDQQQICPEPKTENVLCSGIKVFVDCANNFLSRTGCPESLQQPIKDKMNKWTGRLRNRLCAGAGCLTYSLTSSLMLCGVTYFLTTFKLNWY